MSVRIIHGDCLDVLKTLDCESVDAVVTDPPFNWSFMGKTFDTIGSPIEYQRWSEAWGREALRVLKPGGFALVCGGDRTYHRQTCGLEDAGFRPRTCIVHLHGQGFPKHKWQLKPAAEFWALLQKPFKGSAEACVARYGTGAINVDGTRIGTTDDLNGGAYAKDGSDRYDGAENWRFKRNGDAGEYVPPSGRWPSNCVLSHIPPDEDGNGGCKEVGTRRVKGTNKPTRRGNPSSGWGFAATDAIQDYADPDGFEEVAAWECARDPETGEYICPVALLDAQSGELKSGAINGTYQGFGTTGIYGEGGKSPRQREASSGGASRFFYTAKSSRAERDLGGVRNTHPCVKSLSLMTWLAKLVCPPGGTILDPFAGSGSTLVAADRLGFDAIGIEREAEYVAIAQARINGDAPLLTAVSVEPAPVPAPAPRQMELIDE